MTPFLLGDHLCIAQTGSDTIHHPVEFHWLRFSIQTEPRLLLLFVFYFLDSFQFTLQFARLYLMILFCVSIGHYLLSHDRYFVNRARWLDHYKMFSREDTPWKYRFQNGRQILQESQIHEFRNFANFFTVLALLKKK